MRPISMLPALAKIIEKILYRRLYPIIQPRLQKDQFGGITGCGTADEVCELVSDVLEHYDECADNVTVAAVLDFSAAFDRVAHAHLMGQLQVLGVPAFLIPLVAEYLAGRTLRVLWRD